MATVKTYLLLSRKFEDGVGQVNRLVGGQKISDIADLL